MRGNTTPQSVQTFFFLLPKFHLILVPCPTQGIYYLMFSSREERDKWAYFCMMASGVFSVETGTPTEQVLRRLEELDAQSLSHPDLANPVGFGRGEGRILRS